MPDVFKILKDLEMRAVGLDPDSDHVQEGYFVSFRSVGLPIFEDDFENPYSPFGGNLAGNIEKALNKPVPVPDAADPASAPKVGGGALTETAVFAAEISKSYKAFLNTFLLVDDKMQMSDQAQVMPSSSKVSDSWWAIITGANGVASDLELDADQKAAIEKATAVLQTPDGMSTPKYDAYMQWESAYHDARQEYNKAYANAMADPMRLQAFAAGEGRDLHDAIESAQDKWNGLGHKAEIETAIAELAAQGMDPAIALIARAKKRFENSLVNIPGIGNVPYTLLLPNSWYKASSDKGWNVYTSQDFHTESHYKESSTSYGGGGGINVGFWSAGAEFNHAESRTDMDVKTDDLQVSFSWCAVDVKRPWMDTSLLNLKNWFLVGDYDKGCISDGTMGQHLPGDGKEPTFLPSVVTGLILVKDVTISWSGYSSSFEETVKSTAAGGSVGWGPFAIHGSYSHHEQTRDFEADFEREGLQMPGIQLLGYVSTILPACPGLDSSEFMAAKGKGEK